MIELRDNLKLIQMNEDFMDEQSKQKDRELKLKIVTAAIIDSVSFTPSSENLIELKKEFVTEEEFNEVALPIYISVCDLVDVLTERQQKIIYDFLVNKKRIIDIADEYDITPAGVKKNLSLIKTKAIKLEINELI